MSLPQIIQGGMGVAISTWKLAKAVSEQGHLGVVSGSGVGLILVCRLMDGDAGGHVRRALSHFPYQDVAQRVLDTYYQPDGRAPGQPYKRHTMWTINPPKELNQLTVIANFVALAQGQPPAWVTYSPLLPLALLLFTGLYLFVLPYATKWRSGRRTD